MTTLAEMIAQHAELGARIAKEKEQGKAQAVLKIKDLIAEYGITAADFPLPAAQPRAKPAAKARPDKRSKVKPKYASHDGHHTWSGRGMMPKWLRDEISNGANRESFTIQK